MNPKETLTQKHEQTPAQKKLFDLFDQLDIKTETHYHPAVFTVDQVEPLVDNLPGGHCKCLFLRDKKKRHYFLVVALEHTKIRLKELGLHFDIKHLSFCSANDLEKFLGVTPGSVTPFGLINDTEHKIHVILDNNLFDHEILNLHPLVNTATTVITTDDLKKFINACGNSMMVMTFA